MYIHTRVYVHICHVALNWYIYTYSYIYIPFMSNTYLSVYNAWLWYFIFLVPTFVLHIWTTFVLHIWTTFVLHIWTSFVLHIWIVVYQTLLPMWSIQSCLTLVHQTSIHPCVCLVYICIYVCIYIYVYINIYIFIYIHIYKTHSHMWHDHMCNTTLECARHDSSDMGHDWFIHLTCILSIYADGVPQISRFGGGGGGGGGGRGGGGRRWGRWVLLV